MGLFKSKTSSYLGLDFGTSSIKLVELENVSGRPRLVTYGSVEIDTNVSRDDAKADQAKVASILKALIQRTGAHSRASIAALPNFSVFSSVISLPELSEKQLTEAVQWEAKKFVPMPIENVVLDWKIINTIENANPRAESPNAPEQPKSSANAPVAPVAPASEGKGEAVNDATQKPNQPKESARGNLAKCEKVVRILLTAAPRHLIERYVSIFKLAGLNLISLETESFALSRSLVGNDQDPILIVDVGSLTTDLTVVENGVPVLARSIDIGGKTVTKAIADSMGISLERAEQFKRDVGLGSFKVVGAQPGAVQNSGVAGMIESSFSAVINEMKYSLDLHKSQGQSKITKILITGGSSFLPGLPDYLTRALGIKTYIGNPWARVSYPKDLGDVLEQLAPHMAVSVGLAMREIG